ncbi:hypothetical protein ACUR5C_10690 [Aliikangiella sp. IMCC44653]
MNTFTIISIVVLLVASVLAITFVQRREQQRALMRQKVAQHRYRANQAMQILHNINDFPVGPETRQLLLKYALANFNAIDSLSSSEINNFKNIQHAEQLLKNTQLPVDNQRLNIPADLDILKKQISSLSSLAKFLLKLNKRSDVDSNLVNASVRRILGLISESKISAHIQQGRRFQAKQELVQAQESYQSALKMLKSITNKNERLQSLKKDLLELIRTPEIQTAAQPTPQAPQSPEQEPIPASDNTTEEAKESDEGPIKQFDDGLFGPKKKW